ncbi:MAG: heme biosynthesis protein HemY [Arenimonas sp.]|uniref:heme biosynthesis protein HemY n=1 Tax=Arenimonas sp. TaxID=1872635 RepID=UPI0025BEA553|nr:heme biosynthesis HemY N-terminal domain-containing protein [Arenimonas sp.]MBW8366512.1 heme biosynthesis protein HemY [Arenimonas sp.]
MNLYRSLLWWLALAALGALGWSWFAQDLGDVVVRFRGLTYTTTLAYLVIAWGLLWFSLWGLWWLLQLPIQAWRRHARQQARNRLVSGLEAMHQGRWQRAESLLAKAAEDSVVRTPALLGARRAALAAGNAEGAALHQAALLAHDASCAALEQASALSDLGRYEDALASLDTLANPLPPRALLLQARALAATGRAQDAVPHFSRLRQEQALPAEQLTALEEELAAAALDQAHAATQLQRWNAHPLRLQQAPAVAAAFARRATAVGFETQGAQALADAIDAHWDEALVGLYGRLHARPDTPRVERAQAWLPAHGNSPALLVALGRLYFQQQQWAKAESYLHRALAQGAGAEAWEALGDTLAAQNDSTRASLAYANALRTGRSESTLQLDGRSLREQIADQAVAELRNEHGMPLLPP